MVVLVPTLDTLVPHAAQRSARRRVVVRVLTILVLAVAAFCIPSSLVEARTESLPASSIKAAFVYQFANFVEWPEASFENNSSPLKIGVVGDDELLAALRKIVSGKKIGQRSVEIISNGFTDDELHDCHILFIGMNDKEMLSAYAKKRNELSVLAISDSPSFTQDGGIIRLFDAGKKIGIEINVDAAKRAQLQISSKLLRLATVVYDDDEEKP